MDQPEEILEKLERFNVQKNAEITRELDEYVSFVARTGESVFNWSLVKKLYREKLINVITDFYNETPTKELPQYPNVDPFNYETMKKMLIERLDSFSAAPFTIQRISELLSDPRKQYSRIDKFMRAVEKNILVVSTVSPSRNRSEGSENGDSLDSVGLNGDFSTDVHVDIDMDGSDGFSMTKDFNPTTIRKEPNHDIVTESQETVTIKKVPSKDEASTSTIPVNISNGDSLLQSGGTIETQPSVTITVCEPKEENKLVEQQEIEPITLLAEDVDPKIQKAEDTVIKTDVQPIEPITLLTENVEPKIDDALLNEPLRPADDEILPENPETTPLAALENIVANRVEAVESKIEEIEEKNTIKDESQPLATLENIVANRVEAIESKIEEIEEKDAPKNPETTPQEQKPEEMPEADTSLDDDSGIEAKRIKIEEIDEKNTPENPKVETAPQTETESVAKDEIPVEPIIEEPSEILEKQTIQPEIEKAVEENIEITPIEEQPSEIEPIVAEKDVEDTPIIAEPVVSEEPLATPSSGNMEEIPIVENTMSLDEDVSNAQIPEMEMTTPSNNNKMETDDNEGENVLMDTDETEEPMDQ